MCWVIVSEALNELLPIIKQEFDDVDIKNLPDDFDTTAPVKCVSDLSALHLTEDAPDFLIGATYKRLAKQYHPDGDCPDVTEISKGERCV